MIKTTLGFCGGSAAETSFTNTVDANASTANFITLAEEIGGQDLAGFFDGWLYQNDLPDFPTLELTNSNEEG